MSAESDKQRVRKVVITEDIALEIFAKRKNSYILKQRCAHSSDVAAQHGVSPKSVRDVWDRRTWAKATMPLWTEVEVEDYEKRNKRPPGRPLGKADTRPRKPRSKKVTNPEDIRNKCKITSLKKKPERRFREKNSRASWPLELISESSITTASFSSSNSPISESAESNPQPLLMGKTWTQPLSDISPLEMLVCKSLEAQAQTQSQGLPTIDRHSVLAHPRVSEGNGGLIGLATDNQQTLRGATSFQQLACLRPWMTVLPTSLLLPSRSWKG
eukprot:756069-Hanusia_phi.AAC.4